MTYFPDASTVLLTVFVAAQVLYLLTFVFDFYLFSLPVNWVDVDEGRTIPEGDLPYIVLFYPVLDELEATMRTTFVSLTRLEYPANRHRVIAVANANDATTIASLERLQIEFPMLQIMQVPATSAPGWRLVWDAWDRCKHAYWWHEGARAGNRQLPPKKTRQLIYALYHTVEEMKGKGDFLVNYIDADSCPPTDHFLAGAAGMRRYDVLQAQNIAGNLNDTLAASWHAFDHMAWDGSKYPHLSGNGRQPYWMLGKGLFFRASDLVELGSFHPWVTIEDPEVGMRFWANGKRLGIIENPLIEETPLTFGRGVLQRKRWVCGFFQSLSAPLDSLKFSPMDKIKAWMNFLPCLSLWVNAIGLPTGVWALSVWLSGDDRFPTWLVVLCTFNLIAFALSLIVLYARTWRRTGLVLTRKRDRLFYMLRVNPLFLMIWWVMWLIPLWLGFWMYVRDEGLVWERTEKVNANEDLIRGGMQPSASLTSSAAVSPSR